MERSGSLGEFLDKRVRKGAVIVNDGADVDSLPAPLKVPWGAIISRDNIVLFITIHFIIRNIP